MVGFTLFFFYQNRAVQTGSIRVLLTTPSIQLAVNHFNVIFIGYLCVTGQLPDGGGLAAAQTEGRDAGKRHQGDPDNSDPIHVFLLKFDPFPANGVVFP